MAQLPAMPGIFVDDGRLERSGESFQGIAFRSLKQRAGRAISFFRSDFRKSVFEYCDFYGNNFSRCDFISTKFAKSHFIECDFLTSSIQNSVFDKCVFQRNINFSSDIFRCDLHGCEFSEQVVARATWRDTRFSNCSFKKFSIERSTLENISFAHCDLSGTDLSQMSAMDIFFEDCHLEQTIIDPDYMGSYVFINCDISKLKFAYRASTLNFDIEDPSDLVSLGRHLEAQQRWSEAFNIKVIASQLHASTFHDVALDEDWMGGMLKSIQLDIPSDAADNVARMFRLAKHYLQSGRISISNILVILAFSEEIGRMSLNGLTYEALYTGRALLLNALQALPNIETLLAMDSRRNNLVRFQVQIESDREREVESAFLAIASRITGNIGIPCQILRIGYGSILVEAISTFVVALAFFRTARSASYNLAEMRIVYEAGKRVAEIARNAQDVEATARAIETFKYLLPEEKPIAEMAIDEVKEVAKTFGALAHEIRVGGLEIISLVKEIRIFLGDFSKRK